MSAENQAAAKQTFDFQAMAPYNASQSVSLLCEGKAAQADLDSAIAELLYHKFFYKNSG
ncbi:MAG: hypothetical protein NC251_09970 [Lachnoclostridium sp.]|nr:hypothetical protein [Lachnospira sp.]MCM1248742.1 hypothetical protein [Lachnoclostridium sp.]MCM1535824.1 hypothetical protein [Clostridium sp.]